MRENVAEDLAGPVDDQPATRDGTEEPIADAVLERYLVGPAVDADGVDHLHGLGPRAPHETALGDHRRWVLLATGHRGIFVPPSFRG